MVSSQAVLTGGSIFFYLFKRKDVSLIRMWSNPCCISKTFVNPTDSTLHQFKGVASIQPFVKGIVYPSFG